MNSVAVFDAHMILNFPWRLLRLKTRYSFKYRAVEGAFVLKVTDDKTVRVMASFRNKQKTNKIFTQN